MACKLNVNKAFLHILPYAHVIYPVVNSDYETIKFSLNYINYKLNLFYNSIVKYKRNFQKSCVESILNYLIKEIRFMYFLWLRMLVIIILSSTIYEFINLNVCSIKTYF